MQLTKRRRSGLTFVVMNLTKGKDKWQILSLEMCRTKSQSISFVQPIFVLLSVDNHNFRSLQNSTSSAFKNKSGGGTAFELK